MAAIATTKAATARRLGIAAVWQRVSGPVGSAALGQHTAQSGKRSGAGVEPTLPGFDGTESVLLAVGILGATVMPHVIYLHSALTQHRIVGLTDEEKRRIFRFELVDVVIAMSIAGLINMSMLTIAASVFHAEGLVAGLITALNLFLLAGTFGIVDV